MRFAFIPLIPKKVRWPGCRFVLLMLLFLAAGQVQAQTPEAETSAVAYVAAEASGPGKRGDSARPYASLQQALAAGAHELRIEPGVYREGSFYVGGGGKSGARSNLVKCSTCRGVGIVRRISYR